MKWKEDGERGGGVEAEGPHGFRIAVHHHIHYPRDVWLVSTYHPSVLDRHELKSKDLADAKGEAVAAVAKRLEELRAFLRGWR